MFWGDDRKAHSQRGMNMPGEGGKTKGEMLAEARRARDRRELERVGMMRDRETSERQRRESLARRGGQDRSWWEVEGRRRGDSVMLGTDMEGPVGEGKKVEAIAEEGEREKAAEEEEEGKKDKEKEAIHLEKEG